MQIRRKEILPVCRTYVCLSDVLTAFNISVVRQKVIDIELVFGLRHGIRFLADRLRLSTRTTDVDGHLTDRL
jgi:hypothetical protein